MYMFENTSMKRMNNGFLPSLNVSLARVSHIQSMWEVADLSTIITSSKLNHEDENEFIYNRVYVNGGKADWDTVRI